MIGRRGIDRISAKTVQKTIRSYKDEHRRK